MKQSKVGFLAAICMVIIGLIPVMAFATDKKTETAQAVLEKMGQANDYGEFLAKWTTLGNALENVPDKAKKGKTFFNKTTGPLNAAVNAKSLFENVRDYKTANDKKKGEIGKEVAKSFYGLIEPVVNATPQGALINVSIQTSKICYANMMNSSAQYNFNQASSGLYGANAVISGEDYISENSPWYGLASLLFVDKVRTSEILAKVTKLEQLDHLGTYSKIALACYKDGATVDQIYNVVSALVEINNLNKRKAQELKDAERQQYLAQLAAEEKKKQEDAKRLADEAAAAAAKAKAENQKTIQAYCKFSTPQDVWKAMDTHKFANSLYRVWANSYPTPLLSSKPKDKTDKQIIQERCKFSTPDDVWKVVAKHKFANDLLRVWADSYYQGLR